MAHHHLSTDDSGMTVASRVIAAGLAAAIIAGGSAAVAAPAFADPGGQGGVTFDTSPNQGGVTDTPPPPARGTSIIPTPAPVAPPVYETAPTQNTPTVFTGPTGPIYSTPEIDYTPTAPTQREPIRPQARPAPFRPRLAAPGFIRVGNYTAPKPAQISDADARAINAQLANLEASIAQGYNRAGVPRDVAARRAATTVLGVAGGATAGFFIVGVPAAAVGAVTGLVVGGIAGAAIGSVVPPTPFNTLPGLGIGLAAGAGVGAIAGLAGGGLLGAAGGGLIGGLIGDAIGGGDPNAQVKPLPAPGTPEDPRLSTPPPPNPDANQYELHLDRTNLPGNGKVDYVVAKNGDVSGEVNIGPIKAPIAINHDQADAPFKGLGLVAQTARDNVNRAVTDISAQAEKAIPGLKIDFPQLTPPPAKKAAAATR